MRASLAADGAVLSSQPSHRCGRAAPTPRTASSHQVVQVPGAQRTHKPEPHALVQSENEKEEEASQFTELYVYGAPRLLPVTSVSNTTSQAECPKTRPLVAAEVSAGLAPPEVLSADVVSVPIPGGCSHPGYTWALGRAFAVSTSTFTAPSLVSLNTCPSPIRTPLLNVG